MAVDDTWTACFRDCCGSGDVNLAVPKAEFAGNLRQNPRRTRERGVSRKVRRQGDRGEEAKATD
jgi:hypothetical protein